ncbi:hypothetical protein ACW5EG_01600 [Luteimonas sp. A611]
MQIRLLFHAAACRAMPVIATVLCVAGLLAGCTPGKGGGGGPVQLGGYEDAIRVTPTLDEAHAITETIGYAGGSISATTADGTVFTLTVPANSLRQVTQITMTPVIKLDGLPFGKGTDVTVDLQPSGLVFDVPATLAIKPAVPIPAGEQILYAYSDSRLVFAEPVLKAEGIAIVVPHFSGYGAAKGLMGDVEEARKRIGGSAEERIASEMRAVLQEAQQAELRGEPVNLNALLDPYFEQMDQEVVIPRLEAAGQSCAAGRSAIMTVLDYARQRELLGYEEEGGALNQAAELLENTVAPKCMDEEYQMCVNEHIVHRIAPAYLGFDRQLMLFGIDNSPVLEKMKKQVEGCLHFDLDLKIDSTLTHVTEGDGMVFMDGADFTAEVALELDRLLGEHHDLPFAPSSGPMTSRDTEVRAVGNCTPAVVSGWNGAGLFLKMDVVVEPASLDEGGGSFEVTGMEIELPAEPLNNQSGGSCHGKPNQYAGPTTNAVSNYLLLHGDGNSRSMKIDGWTTQGGEIFATAEWTGQKQVSEAHTFQDKGTATLRHTPQPAP